MATLTHIDSAGQASMVDVSAKPDSAREAVAVGRILMQPETLTLVRENGMKKGDVLGVARIAAIQAAKQTQMLIPLCHQIPLSVVRVEFQIEEDGIAIEATAKTIAATGVEMEALMAVTVAGLTIFDMCKAVDKKMSLTDIRVMKKTKEQVRR